MLNQSEALDPAAGDDHGVEESLKGWDFPRLVARLRDHLLDIEAEEMSLLQSLDNDSDDEVRASISRMLGRDAADPDLLAKSTFEHLVYARLVFEVPFVQFDWIADENRWSIMNKTLVPGGTNSNDELYRHLSNSLWTFLQEDTRRSIKLLGGGNGSIGQRSCGLSKRAVFALHGLDRNGKPPASWRNTSTPAGGILPSYMDVEFRRTVCQELLDHLEKGASFSINHCCFAECARIFEKVTCAKPLPLMNDLLYRKATRGCGDDLAAYFDSFNPVVGERNYSDRLEVLTCPLRKKLIFDINECNANANKNSIEFINDTFENYLIHDALPPEDVQRVIHEYDRLPFVEGKGGRTGSRVRCVSKDPEATYFFVGSGPAGTQWAYPTDYASGFECYLLDKFQTIMDVQNAYVAKQYGRDYSFNVLRATMLHCNVTHCSAGGYGEHDDTGPNHNRKEDDNCMTMSQAEAKWLLPTRGGHQTLTYVLTSDDGIDYTPSHAIQWLDSGGKGRDGDILGVFELGSNDMHWQGPGSQYSRHRVIVLPYGKTLAGPHWRMVITVRATYCPLKQPREHRAALEEQLVGDNRNKLDSLPDRSEYLTENGALVGVLSYFQNGGKRSSEGKRKSEQPNSGPNSKRQKKASSGGNGKSRPIFPVLPTRKKKHYLPRRPNQFRPRNHQASQAVDRPLLQ